MKNRKPPQRALRKHPNGKNGNGKNGNGKSRPRTLGPVFNLEQHVASDWWNRIFNSMYLKTDGDVVDDQRITRTEVDRITQLLNLPTEARILDLCCGQGRHCLELARRGYRNVEGLDRSHYLIEKAKVQARGEGSGLRFREGDARKLPYATDTFDAVLILGNSFGYFDTREDDLKVLKEIARVMVPGGRLMIDVSDGTYLRHHFQKRSWEWINKKLFVCRERELSQDGERLVSREVITHVEKGILADQFYAERLYSKETLQQVLTSAGFSDVAFPVQWASESERAQDLGMMERRIMTVSRLNKLPSPTRRKPAEDPKHIVVIMGDPGKPDGVKPQNVFDEDDFHTIDQMKLALSSLRGARFTYLSGHNTLMTDLARLTGKVDLVFNLCDEGYFNFPRKELHVPALLEILGIPYTGSGPQCLAFCYDKSLVRGVAKEMDIPVAEGIFIKPEDHKFELPFDFPAMVKPNFGDSSFGITARSVVRSAEELINAINEIRYEFGYDKPILIEEFLPGKDLTIGILGTPPSYSVLPLGEEDYSAIPAELPQVCGYEAKWDPTSPYWNIKSRQAQLPENTEKDIIAWSVKLAERLECRDYTRLDWRLDAEGNPHLLEVNPNPGWCWDGHMAKMAGHAGLSYAQLLATILRAAAERVGLDLDLEVVEPVAAPVAAAPAATPAPAPVLVTT